MVRPIEVLGLVLLLVPTLLGCGEQAGGEYYSKKGRFDKAQLAELLQQLQDDNPTVRKNACDHIIDVRPRGDAALPLIAPLIKDFGDFKGQLKSSDARTKSEAVLARKYAAETFSCMHSDATVQPLIEACQSKDPLVRAMGYYALGSVPIDDVKKKKPKEILAAMVVGLKDEDAEARYYVGYAFDKSLCIMSEEVVPPMLEALKVDHPQFQCFLLRSLCHLGPKAKAGAPLFAQLAKNPDPTIASVAQRALLLATQTPETEEGKNEEKPKDAPEPEKKQTPAKPDAGKDGKAPAAAGKESSG